MPWTEVDDEKAVQLHKQRGTHYVVFFASNDPATGEPWCPDCRDAKSPLEHVFNAQDAPTLNVVRVGQREAWKTPANKWRSAPYKIDSIPTLVKLNDGKEVGRLGEEECKSEKDLEKLLEQEVDEANSSWGCIIV